MTLSTLAFFRRACLYHLCAVLLSLPIVVPMYPAGAQIFGAAERAAARAAAGRAKRPAVKRSLERSERATAGSAFRREGADLLVRRWSTSLCRRPKPCPLPEKIGNSFRGGSYNEVILGRDTTFYRVYTRPEVKYGVPGERYSFWSRSSARGTGAVIDGAIPVSRNGNVAARQVSITLRKGTKVFDGYAAPLPRGPVGGGSQVVIERSVLAGAGR